jgi:outer membrane protein insertion porin family
MRKSSLPAVRYLAVLLLLALSVPAAQAFRVSDIRVDGLQRISAGTVFNYLPLKPGEVLNPSDTAKIIRALYKTGFFKDVRLEREGDVLVVLVVERPAISEIEISGNKSIETEALKQGLKDIGLEEGRTFNSSVLDRIEQELRRQYFNQGKYGVSVESTVTPLERNRVALNIDIVEGATARIKRINIIGNESFDEEELLDEFQLSTGRWYSFWSDDDQYSRQKLAADLETLRSHYLDRGYINFKVDSTQVTITPDKKDIYVTINIDEGQIYRISDIRLAGDLVTEPEELFPLIHLRRGESFSRRMVVDSTERINQKLADLGYAFANVNSIPEIDAQTNEVGLTFFVDPGKRVYVRRINISGNRKTRDAVVRREFRQMESAWFSSEKLKLSRERVQRLDFFEDLSLETPAVPGSGDQVDIDVAVTEKPSGAFLAGLGFSQSQGIIFNSSITQANFLGTGKRVTVAFNNSSLATRYQLSYVNPYYTVDGISRGFDLSYQATDFEEVDTADYQTDTGIAGMTFGIPLSEFNRFNFGFQLRSIDFKLGSFASDELVEFREEEGDNFLDFELNTSWRHDSRDSALFATTGSLQTLGAEMAVPGSDLQYYKIEYRHRRYFPLYRPYVLSVNAEVGYGDGYGDSSSLPIFENFFAGGPRSVRGYKAFSLGPRDSLDEPLGGNIKLTGTAELLFPPPFTEDNRTVRLSAFLDFGNVFDDEVDLGELRYSTGLGFSWLSPVGALSLSFATPLNDEQDDDVEKFQFTFGSTF